MDESHSMLKDFLNFLARNLFPLAALIALLALAVTGAPLVLEFKSNFLEEGQRLITSLFVVTVFLERALEVFVVTWRGPESNRLDSEISLLSEEIALEARRGGGSEKLQQLQKELAAKQRKRISYKSDTQRMALWGGLLMGALIGVAGLRVLSSLLANLDQLSGIQLTVFRITDVLLTGGLLAGGSEGIHKIYKVYSEFMDATANKAKASNPNSDVALRAEARSAETRTSEEAKPQLLGFESPFGGAGG